MAEERVQRRLAAILVADVVGYSRLMREDEAGTLTQFRTIRDEIVDPKVAEYGGRVFKSTGDGFLIEFPSVINAVQHAVDVQRTMAERNGTIPDEKRMELRMGINLGDVVVEGDDLLGDGVNVAARLEGLADAGGVCVSEKVRDEAIARLNVAFESLGPTKLKNINEPIQLYRVLFDKVDGGLPTRSNFEKPSVAVLPFENMSGDPEQEYFSDGITEDIITALSRLRWFRVIARNSTFAYKEKSVDVRQVAQDLDVRYVVEGSVRKAGDRVRLTAQLIEGATGDHVWARHYDRDLDDIFEVQDELTQTIVAAIEPELGYAERERVHLNTSESLDAWDAYQRGMWHFYKRTRQDYVEAERYLRQAVELDGNLGLAFAGLADTLSIQAILGFSDSASDLFAEAVSLGQQSVSIDERNPLAHAALGTAYFMGRQPENAIPEFVVALEINPSSANSHYGLGAALMYTGDFEAAIGRYEIAIGLSQRDPYTGHYYAHMAQANLLLQRYEEAADWASRALLQPAAIWPMAMLLASSLGHLGRTDEGGQAIDELFRLNPDFSERIVRDDWPNPRREWQDHILDGLRKAGFQE